MKPLISLLILVTLVFSCQKTDNCDPNSPSLIGSWTWIKSIGGIAGVTITPATTGKSIKINFSADSIYRMYLNDSLVIESKFRLAYMNQERIPYLKFDGFASLYFGFTDCNNLITGEIAADGYSSYYKRQ